MRRDIYKHAIVIDHSFSHLDSFTDAHKTYIDYLSYSTMRDRALVPTPIHLGSLHSSRKGLSYLRL